MLFYSKRFLFFYPILFLFVACSEHSVSTSEMSTTAEVATMPDTTLATERVILKTANISMDVRKVEESILNLQSLVNDLNGHVFHYEIQNDKTFQNEVQQTIDSCLSIEEIRPVGLLKVKIPVIYGDTFIAQVMRMDGSINQFILDEEDITEEITEKKELMESDYGLASEHTGRKPKSNQIGNIDEIYLKKELNESYINRKSAFSTRKYRSNYLWFDIRFSGQKYLSKTMTASFKPIRTPFLLSAREALVDGWHGISVLILFLIRIWPLAFVGLIIALVFKKWGALLKSHLRS